jgi:hypothetical protein
MVRLAGIRYKDLPKLPWKQLFGMLPCQQDSQDGSAPLTAERVRERAMLRSATRRAV